MEFKISSILIRIKSATCLGSVSREMDQRTPLQNLPKHDRYAASYRRFGYYWGLGVEHETYLLTSQTRKIRAFDALAMKPERYSVSYYKAYKPDVLQEALADVLDTCGGSLTVPILMNCHSFMDCDAAGEHITTHEKVPTPNPRYAGKTLFDVMRESSPWLREEYGRVFMWDGDTVEFMTQQFYRTTVDAVMQELTDGEDRFIRELRKVPRRGILAAYGPLKLAAPRNEPWATYLTNLRGVAMFNNGTMHINVTLPTRLGWNRMPLWPRHFREGHQRLARLVQWFEPLWIAAHGSGDPFTVSAPHMSGQFAAGSQRLAVSRYIGVGTFDTVAMPAGKILQVQRSEVGPLPWYDRLHARTAYAPLDVIGLDINYNKHWAHGLELRFLDQMPMAALRSILEHIVVLMDVAMEGRAIPDPRQYPQWQTAAGDALYEGTGWRVSPEFLGALCQAMGIASDQKEPLPPSQALQWIMQRLEPRQGFCWRSMVSGEQESVGCCCR